MPTLDFILNRRRSQGAKPPGYFPAEEYIAPPSPEQQALMALQQDFQRSGLTWEEYVRRLQQYMQEMQRQQTMTAALP